MEPAPAAPPASLSASLEAEIEAIYRDVDLQVAALGVACWIRGDCCDFERSEHVLFASTLEIAHVRGKHPEAFEAGSRLCPFWLDGKCRERERRPLGCRTYFCDQRYRDELEAIYERHHRRLRGLAEAHGFPWSYEPFVAALRRPGGSSQPARGAPGSAT